MIGLLNEHERTMAFAEVALGQIKSLRQTAVPRNYEIWYVYATGYNPALNKIINETLARSGKLSETDLEQIYDTYLSQLRASDRIDKVGARVVNEIDDVMTLINEAIGSASYGQSLDGATEKLTTARTPPVRAVVEKLVARRARCRTGTGRWKPPGHLEDRDQQPAALARGDPRREPDRSADLARQPQVFRPRPARGRAERRERGEPLSLIMFDIDYFKSFNDNYGHLTGDQVLRLVAMSLKQNIKGQDITARYGGEEFAVVLPNTILRQALTVADHIRRAVMSKELKKKSTGEILGRVTISAGVSMLQSDERHPDRTRRRLPLRRQTKRPQPRDLRGRSGIFRRDADPGGLRSSRQRRAGSHALD